MPKKPDNLCVVEGCKRERERRGLLCWPDYRLLLSAHKPYGLDLIVEAYEKRGIPIRVPRKYPVLTKEQVLWAQKHIRAKSMSVPEAASKLKVGENTLYRALYRLGFRDRCPS